MTTIELKLICRSLCLLDSTLNGDHLASETTDPSTRVAEKCRRLANRLAHSLTDSKDWASSKPQPTSVLRPSPPEKYVLQVSRLLKLKKSNLQYTRGSMPKRVTNSSPLLSALATQFRKNFAAVASC